MKKALIIFEKNKVLGKVKTRLAATVGDDNALRLYVEMTRYIHELIQTGDQDNFIYYSDFVEENHPNEFQSGIQFGQNLGERMLNAFLDLKAKGYDQVLIIGTDCIELTEDNIVKAYELLETNDIVIGPAEDGGYYLLGLNHIHPEIFTDMEWSTDAVLAETLKRTSSLDLNVGFLPVHNDIDDLEDLNKSSFLKGK